VDILSVLTFDLSSSCVWNTVESQLSEFQLSERISYPSTNSSVCKPG